MRARAAELRAQGWGWNRIATDLGVGVSTVIRWLDPDYNERQLVAVRDRKRGYAGACADCGKPTSGCNGPGLAPLRCVACTADYRRVWTREVVIEAIRLFVDRYGRIPTAQEWSPALARQGYRDDLADRFYAEGCWPTVTTVKDLFGSWNAGMTAAGFTPRGVGKRGPGSWSREAILAALLRQPRQPACREWRHSGFDHPQVSTVKNVFGSWSAMLEAAGLERLPAGRPRKAAA
jgi:hypothetical protein